MSGLHKLLDDGLREDKPGRSTTPTRRQRITLLLGSYLDARGAAGSHREGRPGKPESRRLEHSPLWYEGSYHELQNTIDLLNARAPKVCWHTWQFYVLGIQGRPVQKRKASLGVEFLKRSMPRFISVPDDVLRRGGFKAEREKDAA